MRHWKAWSAIALVLLAGFASARIASTYRVFSQTYDEPAHLGAGMEWMDTGTYNFDPVHPPLARIAVALGPYLEGFRLAGLNASRAEGNNILYSGRGYVHNLAVARLGVLPFFVVGTCVVWAWSRRLFGDGPAVFATLLFVTTPPVLAHSGVATTDMALAATLPLALLAFQLWLERPTLPRSLALGLAAALAILAKLSALVFLPACGLAILAWHRFGAKDAARQPAVRWQQKLGLTVVVTLSLFFFVWAGYRFSVGYVTTPAWRPHETIDRITGTKGTLHDLAYFLAEETPIPVPELYFGFSKAAQMGAEGNWCYVLGRKHQSGVWYYYPVALFFKTPLAFLILTGVGLILLRQGRGANTRDAWLLAISAAMILLVCMTSKVDLGLRYALPVYPLLAILAGFGAAALWNWSPRILTRAALVSLLAWQVFSCLYIHPDYLAYFNELAGPHPERILVDSDLDWGQDLLRLADALRARRVEEVTIGYHGTALLEKHGLPPFRRLVPYQPTTGWVAISLTKLKIGEFQGRADAYSWLEAYRPVALVGRSIRLYYVPARSDRGAPSFGDTGEQTGFSGKELVKTGAD